MTKWLLLPFSGIYGLLTDFRNWLYDKDLLRTFRPDRFSISVGNLTVGGTGKTPMVEYLIKRHLNDNPSAGVAIGTISRGYGRRTTGFRLATEADTAATIGDEPRQIYRKFAGRIRVCVGERRVEAAQRLVRQHPNLDRLLLDDAFQHRSIRPHLNLLLTDFNRLFYNDYPFPAGRLRERRHGTRRADAVVVTKCSLDLAPPQQQAIQERVNRYTRPGTPVFFAGLRYGQPISFATRQPVALPSAVKLVSGIANADGLQRYVTQTFGLQDHFRFADHHAYTRAELARIVPNDGKTPVLTTEKDWVKLDALLTADERAQWPLYYLPIEVAFLDDQETYFGRFLDESTLKIR